MGHRAEDGLGLLWNRRQELRSGTEMAQTHFSVLHAEPLLELSVPPGDASHCSANTSGLQAGIADFVLLYWLIATFSDSCLLQATFGLEKEEEGEVNCINLLAIKLKNCEIILQQHIHVLIKSNSAFLGHINCCSKKKLQINIK